MVTNHLLVWILTASALIHFKCRSVACGVVFGDPVSQWMFLSRGNNDNGGSTLVGPMIMDVPFP